MKRWLPIEQDNIAIAKMTLDNVPNLKPSCDLVSIAVF
jgi:hypothetical protein